MKNVLSAIPATLALLSLLSGSVFADAVRESARALHANAGLVKYANPGIRRVPSRVPSRIPLHFTPHASRLALLL